MGAKKGAEMNEENTRMTKKDLLDAMEGYPDDTPVTVATGLSPQRIQRLVEDGAYLPVRGSCVPVWALSDSDDLIILEL